MASKPSRSVFGLDDSIPLVGTEDIFGYKQNNPQVTRDSNPFGYTPEEIESFRKQNKPLEEKAAEVVHGSGNLEFSFIELDNKYVIFPVRCDGKLYIVDWSKNLLYNNSYKQDEWIKYLKSNNSIWSLPSGLLYHATIKILHQNRNGKYSGWVEHFRRMLRTDFRNNCLMTSTRIKYLPEDNDRIAHNYGSSSELELYAEISGLSDWINTKNKFENSIEALLGTRNLAEAEELYEWISGKNPWFWRIKEKTTHEIIRALVFGIGSDGRFAIDVAGVGIDCIRPARGVVCHEINL